MPTSWEQLDWYEEAQAYDAIFDVETAREADFVEAMLARFGPAVRGRPRVLEPACGTGRLVVALAERGWAVTGYDLSRGSLAYARERLRAAGLEATLVRAAMQSYEVGRRFHVAVNLVSTFKYLATEADAAEHLRRTTNMLVPGGLYLLGVHLTDYEDRRPVEERWRARRDGNLYTCAIRSWPANRRARTEQLRARVRIRPEGSSAASSTGGSSGGRASGSGGSGRSGGRAAQAARADRRFESHWTFRTYGLGQLRSLLRREPRLELVRVHTFEADPDRPVPFDGVQLDNLLVLRRRD